MPNRLKKILESKDIAASAPCRIDMGGTLDINTFYYPLRHLTPCTFNIAIDLRTKVHLLPYKEGMVKVSSKGFKSAEYLIDDAPFNHSLGLIFAVASYFRAGGVHIDIDSSSPPRSALGGSSAATVALVAAFSALFEQIDPENIQFREKTALIAHALEESVAGVPCGLQDQLAASFGGVNAWYWTGDIKIPFFRKNLVFANRSLKCLEEHLLLAYCGVPHESKNINERWVKQFVSGTNRNLWTEVVDCTKKFVEGLSTLILTGQTFKEVSTLMNKETAIRKRMTPDVLDDMGEKLTDFAVENNCGARFTGAGGGGCIWALGEINDIKRLKRIWEKELNNKKGACLLNLKIDFEGLKIDSNV